MRNINGETNNRNLVIKKWTKISDETTVSVEMIGHIHRSIIKKRKSKVHFTSKNATKLIIEDLINNGNGSIQGILKNNGIKSSEDFGTILKKLCEEGIVIKEPDDDYEDFNGHFKTEAIDDFIKLQKLKKDRDWFKIISYLLYVMGFVIVVSSYAIDMPNKISWIGWGLGMLGWILLAFKNKIIVTLSKINK